MRGMRGTPCPASNGTPAPVVRERALRGRKTPRERHHGPIMTLAEVFLRSVEHEPEAGDLHAVVPPGYRPLVLEELRTVHGLAQRHPGPARRRARDAARLLADVLGEEEDATSRPSTAARRGDRWSRQRLGPTRRPR